MNHLSVGIQGEQTARNYLEEKGYVILDKNYFEKKCGIKMAEIDIVAQKKINFWQRICGRKEEVVFVEVKSSAVTQTDFTPEMRFDSSKKEKIARLAEVWMNKHRLYDWPWRIDVISVQGAQNGVKAVISHFENV